MMNLRKLILLSLAAFMISSLLAAPGFSRSRQRGNVLKVATLAPKGSAWYELLKEAAREISKKTNGSVKLKLYPGGVAGDEPDVVRKIRAGQLHGGALTSVGLSEIESELMVLQAPGVIQTWEELDAARSAMDFELRSLLRKKGFEVLVWGDVGFTRVFSNSRIETPQQITNTKPWCWTQDGVTREFFKELLVNPVMLSMPEVLPGLQTGLLDSYVVPPLVSLSLQWFTRSKYMYDLPLSVNIGAVVLSAEKYNRLSDEQKQAIQEVGQELTPKMKAMVRQGEENAVRSLKKAGITVVTPKPAQAKAWRQLSLTSAKAASGKVYSADLLEQLKTAVGNYRKSGKY